MVVPSIRPPPPPAAAPVVPIAPWPPLTTAPPPVVAPEAFAVPALLVPEGFGVFDELPAPDGSLSALLRPAALAGPDGTPLMPCDPAPAEPALGVPAALELPTEGPDAAPALAPDAPPPLAPPPLLPPPPPREWEGCRGSRRRLTISVEAAWRCWPEERPVRRSTRRPCQRSPRASCRRCRRRLHWALEHWRPRQHAPTVPQCAHRSG